jgi:hypothetical protein
MRVTLQPTRYVVRTPPPRLSLLQASNAPVAVILRRGPSKLVEVIRWDTDTDIFVRGHWFKGRIYEKRSDLSPDGELMVYFASQFAAVTDPEYTYAWTAVSRVPWLTALALWPKGDCWWGGGLFEAKRKLWLNHTPEQAVPHPAHKPTGLKVTPNPDAHGEDEPIYRRRLERDGWTLRTEWTMEWRGIAAGFVTTQEDERVKAPHRLDSPVRILLRRRMDRLSYRELFSIEGAESDIALPPGPVQWVDWDKRDRVIALAGGRVWAATVEGAAVSRFVELLDLRADTFEERAAPGSARNW